MLRRLFNYSLAMRNIERQDAPEFLLKLHILIMPSAPSPVSLRDIGCESGEEC